MPKEDIQTILRFMRHAMDAHDMAQTAPTPPAKPMCHESRGLELVTEREVA